MQRRYIEMQESTHAGYLTKRADEEDEDPADQVLSPLVHVELLLVAHLDNALEPLEHAQRERLRLGRAQRLRGWREMDGMEWRLSGDCMQPHRVEEEIISKGDRDCMRGRLSPRPSCRGAP